MQKMMMMSWSADIFPSWIADVLVNEDDVDENLDLFQRMRAGEFADGSRTLRAIIDMTHPNLNMRDPVLYRILRAEHHRTGNEWNLEQLRLGQAITGGYVYRGTAIPDLVGWYVFADYVQGTIFGVTADSQPTVVPDVLEDTTFLVSSFAEGLDGELYVLSYGTGEIYQIVDAP